MIDRDRLAEILRGSGARCEGDRMRAVLDAGAVPDACGPEIPVAPARGPVRAVEVRALYPSGADGYAARPAGFAGRRTMVRADAFDLIVLAARRAGRPAPLTPAQVGVGRFYGALHERHASAGVRCSSVEAVRGGGSGGAGALSFVDVVLRDRAELDRLRGRIGAGVARPVQRAGGRRVAITDRRLVDAVAIEGQSLAEVLRGGGWAVKGPALRDLEAALAAALQRMVGAARRGVIRSVHL